MRLSLRQQIRFVAVGGVCRSELNSNFNETTSFKMWANNWWIVDYILIAYSLCVWSLYVLNRKAKIRVKYICNYCSHPILKPFERAHGITSVLIPRLVAAKWNVIRNDSRDSNAMLQHSNPSGCVVAIIHLICAKQRIIPGIKRRKRTATTRQRHSKIWGPWWPSCVRRHDPTRCSCGVDIILVGRLCSGHNSRNTLWYGRPTTAESGWTSSARVNVQFVSLYTYHNARLPHSRTRMAAEGLNYIYSWTFVDAGVAVVGGGSCAGLVCLRLRQDTQKMMMNVWACRPGERSVQGLIQLRLNERAAN